ncbi:3-hydroxyisobutyrate dehydrogenase [Penicillium cosmopolitanum]|uniref:3-hydroxyisobutyrate dehydrogenase n=1 Tax=Penicillium cosmopolitanum TaxID=1131564 RepID=A0A9W9WB52_9EURO|nr:3-hydroxyisobutyrate dehydrogenase [Penicillium cosmopolitanum]KAJ5414088.1 3-hydroxyisobutyrate dehydrogenase [Penicillium cosmopolitanum]
MAIPTDRANTIGFIGLGAMGNHMLHNLVKRYTSPGDSSQTAFALCDVNDAAVDSVIKRHSLESPNVPFIKCPSPYEVAKQASTIISMVPTGRHVRDVYVDGEKSVFSALQTLSQDQRSATLCMDQSTIEQSVSKAVALELRKAGADMLDAPVSGGVVGAENGTLAIMVGGDKASFDRSVPVLQSMARKVTYCGDLGAGLAAKISNKENFERKKLPTDQLALFARVPSQPSTWNHYAWSKCSEAMLLGKRLGVDPQVLADIINSSTGRCWSSEINHPVPEVKVGESSPPAHRGYEGGFVTKLAHKDLALAVKAAEQAGVPLNVGQCVEKTYRPLAETKEFGDRDFSVIYEALDALKSSEGKPKL